MTETFTELDALRLELRDLKRRCAFVRAVLTQRRIETAVGGGQGEDPFDGRTA